MTDNMKRALLALQQLIIAENPGCISAEICFEKGFVTMDIHRQEGASLNKEVLNNAKN